MKKIVPFNNVLTFNTDVAEITSISLEPSIKKMPDTISGSFHIDGEYKITDGQLEREKFSFELPFDIALGCTYKEDTLVVDIDDFRYELTSNKELKVNIDLYIDGEIIEESSLNERKEQLEELPPLIDELTKSSEEEVKEEVILDNKNNNILNFFNDEDNYVTYRIYRILENDNIDKILEKYHITKEELAKYNSNLDLKPGDKLIIPSDDK